MNYTYLSQIYVAFQACIQDFNEGGGRLQSDFLAILFTVLIKIKTLPRLLIQIEYCGCFGYGYRYDRGMKSKLTKNIVLVKLICSLIFQMMQKSSIVLHHLKSLRVNFVCIAKYSRRSGSDSKYDDVFKIVGKNRNHLNGEIFFVRFLVSKYLKNMMGNILLGLDSRISRFFMCIMCL